MTVRKIIGKITAVILALFLVLCAVMGGQGNLSASAASEIQTAFEESNVLDDLTGGTVGGKKFSLADYPHNSDGKPQIISFTEFCYSYYAEKQGDYGLYVYVYNPQDVAFDTQTNRNRIQLTYGGKASYAKYSLIFCNYSTQAGYEGRFFKFRVQLTDSQRSDILQTIKPDARVYKVSGIELSYKGQVTDYPCAQSYTYTGFAEGYGSELAASDTLSCRVNGFEKYLTLDVHSTYYRPEGTNGKNDYTQDSLHSVYFAIPRSVVSEYGKMTAVHATWLDATLAPVLVTGNKEAYDAILPYLGQNIGTNTEGLKHAYAGSANYTVTSWAGSTALYGWDCAYTFNLPSSWSKLGGTVVNKTAQEVSPLYWLAYAGDGTDSADEYVLSSEEIENKLKEYTQKYGGELVNDRYSRVLFDTVADDFTEVNIRADEEYSLTNEVLGSSWWDKLWGITYPSTFDGIKAIYEVTDADFKGDEKEICDGLFIAERDYAEFKEFYDANKEENVVYLFRYQVTDFISSEATHFVPESGLGEKIGAFELPIVSMSCGSMGKKKTTLITDMVLSQEVMFRQKALQILQTNDMKLPHFPWIMFEDELRACMEHGTVYNLASVKTWVAQKRSRYLRHRNVDWQLYGYDIRRYGATFNDALKVQFLFDVLETYAQAYFIYVIQSSLIVANYSIRTDNVCADRGNFPMWCYDFFPEGITDGRHAHILDFDVLRLGKKVIENNPKAGSFEFGVVAITEIGKERGNNLELKEVKKGTDETNQKNDLFNSWLKMCRHSATVDNFPFIKVFTDEQRPESWGADARDLCDVIHIVSSGDQRLALPFYTIEEMISEWAFNRFVRLYMNFRFRRGDNTMLVHILKSITAWLWRRDLRMHNKYGYCILKIEKERGTMDGKVENKKYFLMNQKIYARRFATDCFSDYFNDLASKSGMGLADYREYVTERASVDELKAQNSYFIRALYGA